MSVVTEKVGATHAGVLAALHEQCFAPADRWSAAAMAELLAQPGVEATILCETAQPVGFLMLRHTLDEAEILTLCVVPDARRRGLARHLLTHVLNGARCDLGVETVFLEVSVSNPAATHLYATAGFTRQGLRKTYYPDGSDALVLAWTCGSGAGG
ncbi:MAG: ribosomal protein S18-alanine N-acetyltransferase [Acetobacter sp.]|uniref:ribosomal protein S18-alanine N-acetyltransferase n=1 Tax=Acetobacter sp. TaxID=440 RepID=UPI0039EB650B